jgi:hypothetical protein
MNHATAACSFDRGDFGQRHGSSAERTGVATTIQLPRIFACRVVQKKQELSARNPIEAGTPTVVSFVHAYGSGDLASQNLIHAECVNMGRWIYRIVLVSLNERSLDYELASKVLCADEPGLGSTANRHCWKREKQRSSHAQQVQAASHWPKRIMSGLSLGTCGLVEYLSSEKRAHREFAHCLPGRKEVAPRSRRLRGDSGAPSI